MRYDEFLVSRFRDDRAPYLPTSNALHLQLQGISLGGFLRELYCSITASRPADPRARRARAAADRTRSKRARAGSRRVKRYGLRRVPTVALDDDGPWNVIRSVRVKP